MIGALYSKVTQPQEGDIGVYRDINPPNKQDEYNKLKDNFSVVTEEMVVELENLIDQFRSRISLPNAFVIPGGSSSSSALDLSRSIIRRAERHVVTLKELNLLASDCVLRYLNRLSDLLFILARYEDRDLPIEYLID